MIISANKRQLKVFLKYLQMRDEKKNPQLLDLTEMDILNDAAISIQKTVNERNIRPVDLPCTAFSTQKIAGVVYTVLCAVEDKSEEVYWVEVKDEDIDIEIPSSSLINKNGMHVDFFVSPRRDPRFNEIL